MTKTQSQRLAASQYSGKVPVDNSISAHMVDFLQGVGLLTLSSICIGVFLAIVWVLGQDSIFSTMVIYGPLSFATILMIRDKFSKVMIVSSCVALGHGLAHKVFPFLDSEVGVNHEVDVWQDQILHAFQGILFGYIFYQNAGKAFRIFSFAFVAGLVLNVFVGYVCWNASCYDFYVWLSLIPATASGLHVAIGSVAYAQERVGWYACVLQGASAISTYFYFRSSDDVLMFFAACRFFEIYFIAPHLVGCVYGRLAICNFSPLRHPSLLAHALFGRIDGSIRLATPYSLWSVPNGVGKAHA
jgi:hypothetical protein